MYSQRKCVGRANSIEPVIIADVSPLRPVFKPLMKRILVLVAFCCAAFLAPTDRAAADPASDRDMANRYMQAAQSGDDDAQFYVGALYAAGVGLQRSDEEAFRWFSRAADHGHSHAMLILGGLYAIGRGVPKDNVKAYKWAYLVASGSKVDEFRNGARQLMGLLETRMTADQISQARSDANRWHATAAAPPPQAPAAAETARAAPLQTAAPAVSSPPAPPVSNPPPAAKVTAKSEDLAANIKTGDIDNLIDQVPHGLRKRFGF